LDGDLSTGKHINHTKNEKYFTEAYFHTTSEVYNELSRVNFQDILLYGIEGFGGVLDIDEYLNNEEKLKKMLHYLRLIEQNSDIIGMSSHYLAVCKKN
jgi:hypothetical protein